MILWHLILLRIYLQEEIALSENIKLISIIIPVYNTEKYLERCLNSLIQQTVKKIEIILVDDGSTDSSGNICDNYAKNHENIKVIHQMNRGQAAARNEGLKIAGGKYIGFVDSDDWIKYDMYETMLEVIENENCDVVECDYIQTDKFSQTTEVVADTEQKKKIFSGDEILREHLLGTCFKSVIWNKLYRKDIINCFFIENKHLEDIFWLYPVLANCKKGAHIYKKIYFYFQRSDSLSGEPYSLKKLEAVECAAERAKFIEQNRAALLPYAEANKIGLGLYHYQKLLLNLSLDRQGGNRKSIYNLVRQNKSKWQDVVSRKQKMWLGMFLKYPEFTGRLRNYLHIGI